MRDFIVLAIILGSVPLSLFNPFIGVLVWNWVSFFNPHRFTWGVAYAFPVAAVVAIPTMIGTLFTRKINRRIFTLETTLLLLLWAWFVFTLIHASQVPMLEEHFEAGKIQLLLVSKVLLMTFVMIMLTNTRNRMRWLFLVTSLSFAALAIKSGVFGLRSGGKFLVWGPPDSFLADNNDFALAMNMALPMMFFVAREEKSRLLRLVLRVGFLLGLVAVVGTYSRGGLAGLAVVLPVIAIKARRKLVGLAGLAVGILLLITFVPQKWTERMSIFRGAQLDRSAEQRLVSWRFAWNLALDFPITGGGFEAFSPAQFARYSKEEMPGGYASSGPHSVYFQMIGEQGFVGLGMLLALVASCWFTLRTLRRRARQMPSFHWVVPYTDMFEVALLGFAASGAFLGRAYFDLFYHLVGGTIILKLLYRRELALAAETDRSTELQSVLTRAEEPVAI